MQTITDEYMEKMLPLAKLYSLVILEAGPKFNVPGARQIIWEHGRRNFALRADGVLAIVCPVADESDVKGIYIFNADVARVTEIMEQDPGVQAGIFIYSVHPCRGFPGSSLPE